MQYREMQRFAGSRDISVQRDRGAMFRQ